MGPNGSSYTNWFNSKTGNSGIIKVTRSYMKGPIKCKDYDATIDITNQWPLVGKKALIEKWCLVLLVSYQMANGLRIRLMSDDVLGYSSHDWRKNTDDAVVVDDKNKLKVNESRVIFTNPKTLRKKPLMFPD